MFLVPGKLGEATGYVAACLSDVTIKMRGLHYKYPIYRYYEPIEEYRSFLVQITKACRTGHPLLVKQLKDLRKKRLRQLRDRKERYKEKMQQQQQQHHLQHLSKKQRLNNQSGMEESDDESKYEQHSRFQPQRRCKHPKGGRKYLYFQKPKNRKQLGRLAMQKPRETKDTARHLLSDLEYVQQQTNIRIDPIGQNYAITDLDIIAHGAEEIKKKKENDYVLKQNNIEVINLDDHEIAS